MTPWSQAEVERLAALSGQGLSAGQIAGALCREFGTGRSRNSVIGKLLRGNGRFGRLHMLPLGGGARAPGMEKKVSARAASPRARKAGAASPQKAAPAAHSHPVMPPPPAEPAKLLTVSPHCVGFSVPAPLPISFEAAVDAGRCLHFVGDPLGRDGPDMPLCGGARAEGVLNTRYCRRHVLGQYQARAVA